MTERQDPPRPDDEDRYGGEHEKSDVGMRTGGSLASRLWSKVLVDGAGCWLFSGYRDRKGYGQIYVDAVMSRRLAHRVAWELANGPIPQGMLVCHQCDCPSCVNPAHLFLGTAIDNNRDMVGKGRHHNQVKTHCVNGHALEGDNLMIEVTSSGYPSRRCAICVRAKKRRFNWKTRGVPKRYPLDIYETHDSDEDEGDPE